MSTDGPDRRPIRGEHAVRGHATLADDDTSVRTARHFVADRLAAPPWDSVLDDALLVTSELVTNARRYGRGLIELWVTLSAGEVRLEVLDRSAQQPRLRHPDSDNESGRGLLIVEALSSEWGVVQLGEAKSVWVLLPVAA